MGKQKIDLEQLYQERFQSFEMNQSPDISHQMLNKLRHFKKLHLIKWLAIGATIVATAVTITLLNIKSTESETNVISPLNQQANEIMENINKTSNTLNIFKDKTENDQSLNNRNNETSSDVITDPLIGEIKNKKSDESPIIDKDKNHSQEDKTPSLHQNQTPISEEGKMSEALSMALIIEDQITAKENIAIEEDKISLSHTKLPKSIIKTNQNSRIVFELNTIVSKQQQLFIDIPIVNITKQNLILKPHNPREIYVKKTKSKSKYKAETLKLEETPSLIKGYLDVHLGPLLWKNNAAYLQPELDTSWNYNLKANAQLSYSTGIAFQLHHENTPLFVQIGLDYQILNEKTDYKFEHSYEDPELSFWNFDSIYETHDILDTFYIIIDDNQFIIDSIFIQETVLSDVDSTFNSVFSKEKTEKSYTNTYTYLNIPLLLGYEFKTKNEKWSFQVIGGAAIAINLKNEGFYYTKKGSIEPYSGKVSPTLIWNLQAAANINYHWKKWQLFMQPEFQYQLEEQQLENIYPARKNQFYKLKFGIRWNIF